MGGFFNRRAVAVIGILWLLFGGLYIYYLQDSQRKVLRSQLAHESAILHRIVSQRVVQHDAHLTSLSALALAGENPEPDLFLQISRAIQNFYPRITAIDLVSLGTGKVSITSRLASRHIPDIEKLLIAAARRSQGELVVLPSPLSSISYLLIKRSPNNDQARFALALQIDAAALVNTGAPIWRSEGASIELLTADGISLAGASQGNVSQVEKMQWLQPLTIRSTLASRTQPLQLTTQIQPALASLYPATRIVSGLVTISVMLFVAFLIGRLLADIRRAERRARLGEQGAQIAHASRINALGEMASGMAHELTQPLTAILSNSQAGVRLLSGDSEDLPRVQEVFAANIAQAKKAARILARLRDWSRRKSTEAVAVPINTCIDNVVFLLDADLKRSGIDIRITAPEQSPIVLGDAVEIEQLLFNLVRNAMDALLQANYTTRERIIELGCASSQVHVTIKIKDNGPGIHSAMINKVFEPFATSKPDGMGLGLALCERIVERMNGEIAISNAKGVGAVAVVTLPLHETANAQDTHVVHRT